MNQQEMDNQHLKEKYENEKYQKENANNQAKKEDQALKIYENEIQQKDKQIYSLNSSLKDLQNQLNHQTKLALDDQNKISKLSEMIEEYEEIIKLKDQYHQQNIFKDNIINKLSVELTEAYKYIENIEKQIISQKDQFDWQNSILEQFSNDKYLLKQQLDEYLQSNTILEEQSINLQKQLEDQININKVNQQKLEINKIFRPQQEYERTDTPQFKQANTLQKLEDGFSDQNSEDLDKQYDIKARQKKIFEFQEGQKSDQGERGLDRFKTCLKFDDNITEYFSISQDDILNEEQKQSDSFSEIKLNKNSPLVVSDQQRLQTASKKLLNSYKSARILNKALRAPNQKDSYPVNKIKKDLEQAEEQIKKLEFELLQSEKISSSKISDLENMISELKQQNQHNLQEQSTTEKQLNHLKQKLKEHKQQKKEILDHTSAISKLNYQIKQQEQIIKEQEQTLKEQVENNKQILEMSRVINEKNQQIHDSQIKIEQDEQDYLDQIKLCNDKRNKIEKEVKVIKEKLKETESQIQELQNEKKQLEAVNGDNVLLKLEINQMKEKVFGYENRIGELQKIEIMLNESNQKSIVLVQQKDVLLDQIYQEKLNNQNNKELMDNMQKDIQEYALKVSYLITIEGEIGELKKKVQELESLLEQSNALNKQLSLSLTNLKKELDDQKEENKKFQKKQQELTDQINTLSLQNQKLIKDSDQIQTLIDTQTVLKSEVDQYKANIIEYKNKFQEFNKLKDLLIQTQQNNADLIQEREKIIQELDQQKLINSNNQIILQNTQKIQKKEQTDRVNQKSQEQELKTQLEKIELLENLINQNKKIQNQEEEEKYDQLRTKFQELLQQNNKLNEQDISKQDELSRLQQELVNLTTQYKQQILREEERIQFQQEDYQNKIYLISCQLSNKNQDFVLIQNQLSQMGEQIKETENQKIIFKDQEVQRIQEQVEQEIQLKEGFFQQLQKSIIQNQSLEQYILNLNNSIKDLENKLTESSQELIIQNKLNEANQLVINNIKQTLKTNEETHQKILEKQKNKTKTLKLDIEHLTKQNSEFQKIIHQLEQRITNQEQKILKHENDNKQKLVFIDKIKRQLVGFKKCQLDNQDLIKIKYEQQKTIQELNELLSNRQSSINQSFQEKKKLSDFVLNLQKELEQQQAVCQEQAMMLKQIQDQQTDNPFSQRTPNQIGSIVTSNLSGKQNLVGDQEAFNESQVQFFSNKKNQLVFPETKETEYESDSCNLEDDDLKFKKSLSNRNSSNIIKPPQTSLSSRIQSQFNSVQRNKHTKNQSDSCNLQESFFNYKKTQILKLTQPKARIQQPQASLTPRLSTNNLGSDLARTSKLGNDTSYDVYDIYREANSKMNESDWQTNLKYFDELSEKQSFISPNVKDPELIKIQHEILSKNNKFKIICDKSLPFSQQFSNNQSQLLKIFQNVNSAISGHMKVRQENQRLHKQRSKQNLLESSDLIGLEISDDDLYIEKIHLRCLKGSLKQYLLVVYRHEMFIVYLTKNILQIAPLHVANDIKCIYECSMNYSNQIETKQNDFKFIGIQPVDKECIFIIQHNKSNFQKLINFINLQRVRSAQKIENYHPINVIQKSLDDKFFVNDNRKLYEFQFEKINFSQKQIVQDDEELRPKSVNIYQDLFILEQNSGYLTSLLQFKKSDQIDALLLFEEPEIRYKRIVQQVMHYQDGEKALEQQEDNKKMFSQIQSDIIEIINEEKSQISRNLLMDEVLKIRLQLKIIKKFLYVLNIRIKDDISDNKNTISLLLNSTFFVQEQSNKLLFSLDQYYSEQNKYLPKEIIRSEKYEIYEQLCQRESFSLAPVSGDVSSWYERLNKIKEMYFDQNKNSSKVYRDALFFIRSLIQSHL